LASWRLRAGRADTIGTTCGSGRLRPAAPTRPGRPAD